MSDNKKIFTIEINGIKQAYDEVYLLKDAINDLEVSLTQSKITTLLSNVFDSVSNISSVFKTSYTDIEKIISNAPKLEAIIKQIEAIHTQVTQVKNITDTANTKPETKSTTAITEKKNDSSPTTNTETDKQIKVFEDNTKKILEETTKSIEEKAKQDIVIADGFTDKIKALVGDTGKREYTQFGLDKADFDKTKPNTAKVTNEDKTINVDASRASFRLAQEEIDNYNKKLDEAEAKAKLFFETELANYSENSEERKAILQVQSEFEDKLSLKRQEATKKEDELTRSSNELRFKALTEILDQIKVKWDEYGSHLTAATTQYQGFLTASSELYKAEAAKITTSIAEIDAKLKESNDKQKALNEEAKTASGGRAIVIEEQLARETAASEELTKQKTEEEKEKSRLTTEAEKREKRAKRLAIISTIPKAVADIAAGISKALSMGLLGIPIAALIAVQGAVQVATIKKQLDKINLEDGGLLRGKRHSQGGMRIEGSNIEVEGDEFVVNRVSTRKNLGLIEYINTQRKELSPADLTTFFARNGQASTVQQHTIKHMYEQGGQLTNLEVIDSTTAPDNNKILEAISRINFQPVVSVVDIVNTQNSITQVKDIAGA